MPFSCATSAELFFLLKNTFNLCWLYLLFLFLYLTHIGIFSQHPINASFYCALSFLSLQFCSLHTSSFSSIFTMTEVDLYNTELLKLDKLFETSAWESDKPEYFSTVVQFNCILSKSRRITVLSTDIRKQNYISTI